MNPPAQDLWNLWRDSGETRELAEAWLTKREGEWSGEDERLCQLLHDAPEQALANLFAIAQLTDDPKLLGSLAAGPFEDFLGLHGEQFVNTVHALALEQPRLRLVLDGVWQGAMSKQVWHRIEVLKQRAFS